LFGLARSIASNYAYRFLNEFFFNLAIGTDQLGNATHKELFNATLKKDSGYKFGNEDETISSVLGKNKRNETLSNTGKCLVWVLDLIDGNHSIKSIEEDE